MPGQREHGLGQHGAADHLAELHAGEGEDRQDGIAQHVAADDLRLRHPFGAGGLDEIERHYLQHRGAREARIDGGEKQTEGDGRQDEMVRDIRDTRPAGIVGADALHVEGRQPVEVQ